MRPGRRLALAIVLLSPVAAGDDARHATETVELSYDVPPGCPDEAHFVAAVRSRAPRARFAGSAPEARKFAVVVERRGREYAGRLVVEQGAGRARRELSSPRCDHLVEAFVFFTAIAIDPSAALGAAEAPPVEEPPPPDDATQEREDRSEPDGSARAGSSPPRRRVPRAFVVPSRERPVWHLEAGAGGWVASGIASSAMLSAQPVVDLGSSATGLSPSLRLGMVWSNSGSQSTTSGQLTLGVRALVLSGCALRFATASGLDVRVCAALEGGVLEVRPFAIAYPTAPDRPWVTAGPLLRAEIPLVARLSAGLDLGLAVPFERERVFVRPGPTVGVIQPLGVRFSAAILVRAF